MTLTARTRRARPGKPLASSVNNKNVRYVLGLMAGTSADGIDAATIRIRGVGNDMKVEFVGHHHENFGRRLQERLLAAMAPASTSTQEIARLHTDLGEAFGHAARQAISGLSRCERPTLIGLAGQTVCHLPRDRRGQTVTLQLGSAAHVAALTRLPVVADFRQSDVAAGGQGAPLVPWSDWVLFRNARISRAVQNIGGIGNVTWVPARARSGQVVAFDTGPGNMIIDGLVSRISDGRRRIDRDGRLADQGVVLEAVLRRWLSHGFFRQRPPRTTGREMFGDVFLDRELRRTRLTSSNAADWVATATAFTAVSIEQSYRRFIGPFRRPKAFVRARRALGGGRHGWPLQIVLTGGGSRNRTLCKMLQNCLPEAEVLTIDSLGIPSEAKEAASFAMMAAARLDGAASNLRQVTGARRELPLGCIYGPLTPAMLREQRNAATASG